MKSTSKVEAVCALTSPWPASHDWYPSCSVYVRTVAAFPSSSGRIDLPSIAGACPIIACLRCLEKADQV